MAAYTRVRKLVNPRRVKAVRKRTVSRSSKKAAHRRRMPPRNADGSFRNRVVHRKRSTPVKARSTRKKASVSTRSNPAYLLTFGSALNPRKRRTTVKAKSRKRKTVKNRRRSINPTRVVVVAPRANRKRAKNPRRKVYARNRRRYTARRNPALFGQSLTSAATMETIGGVLVGVAATKVIVGYMPASIVGIGGSWGKVIASGVSAFLAGMLAKKLSKGSFGDGVLLGGLAQAGSVAVNAISPALGAQFGLGELIPGSFPVPMNPVTAGRNALAAPAAPRISPAGVGRAYASAY